MSFLWGGPSERPDTDEFRPRSRNWWNQYSQALSLSFEGYSEIYRTSCQIGGLLPDPLNWGDAPRPFRGLVVGAVQSGKTSSMIGVSAVALDQGYRIVIILAGGKDDLRRQTARRFNTQLIRQRDRIPNSAGACTLAADVVERPLGGAALPYSIDVHEWNQAHIRVREALQKDEPCVFVIKKLQASLACMRQLLARAYDEFGADKLPTLVLDDECDDASVDRAEMPIPEAIGNLWRLPNPPPVAYVGYTATAAANLLQQPTNELYPENFVYLLRYPDKETTSLTYRELNPNSWYSGSNCFFGAFGNDASPDENFLVDTSVRAQDLARPFDSQGSLEDALISYLVSGAYRLALQTGFSFTDCDALPKPHSMLVQTSASMHEHEKWLRGITGLFGGVAHSTYGTFDPEVIARRLAANEGQWKKWYEHFTHSRERLNVERPSAEPLKFASWPMVRSQIASVAKNVKVRAVNSDPDIGQSLDFNSKLMPDGSKSPPSDIFVIAIGGAKLSRGITLEGLCISYFTRWNPAPTEDTVLQICRWFGYRGSYLAFCRIFTTQGIYGGLQEIDENDHDLRLQLSRLMTQGKTPRDAGLVLKCNPRSLPTAKIGAGTIFETRFSPYQNVFRDVEISEFSGGNQSVALALVQEVFNTNCEVVRNDSGKQRGYVSRDWDPNYVAFVLDSLQFKKHNPALEGNPLAQFHRPVDPARTKCTSHGFSNDLYQVAAYIREWSEMANAGRVNQPPLFNIGISFGEEVSECEPFNFPLMNREISTIGKLNGTWTGRSGSWRGDSRFDDPDPNLLLDDSSLRAEGSNGLLLLYVVHKGATGRQGTGAMRPFHTVTFGISIPEGGPKLKRVTVTPG